MKPKSLSATTTKRDRRNCIVRNIADEKACPECTTNCLLVHRNPVDPLSTVDRFFKIMLGGNFMEVMCVPSAVARDKKWHKYIDREACLEDTTGEKYPVKISKVDNAIAFKEGWGRFASEHHLTEGDFLIFNHVRYVAKLHLIVHIYGKSGGEKVFFQRGHDKNVSTTNRNAVILNEPLESDIMSLDSKKSTSPSVIPKPLCSDIHHHSTATNNTVAEYTDVKVLQLDHAPWDMEPLYRLHRDAQFTDDRTCLYDLSSFEKQDPPAAAKVSISNDESDTMNHAEKIIDSQTDSDLPDTYPLKRKFSSPESQSYKKKNATVEITNKSAPVIVPLEMKVDVNGGERSSTRVPKMVECQDRVGPADNTPVQRDVFISITPSYKAAPDNKKNTDRSGPTSSAEDVKPLVVTGSNIKCAPVNVAPEMIMVDGERSSTHVTKRIECQDRTGPEDRISVQRDVSLSKAPFSREKHNNENIDWSGHTSSAQHMIRKAAKGDTIKTVKKELDIGDEPFHHQRRQMKKQTIIPENVRRSCFNVKKDIKIPKTEPFCSDDISTSFGGRESSTAMIDDKPYLLLQLQLPSVLLPWERLRPIYLRGPDRKVLPVVYQQKNGIRILTSGWQFFKSMYHLRSGDCCRIELEDESKRIYSFEVGSRDTVLNRK